MTKPFVSIVIPVYNGAATISLCLDAIRQLDYPADRYEVIVVDNNSRDETPQIVSQYAVQLVFEHTLQSAYAARNTGIRHAAGEIVAFTDSDCLPDRGWLSRLAEPFVDETVGGVGGSVLNYPGMTVVEQFIAHNLPLRHCDQSRGRYLSGLITANAAYRRQDLMEIGCFGTMFEGSDIDLSWRLQTKTGKRIVFAPDAVVYHKHRSTVKGLFRWLHRSGYGQILMACLYRDVGDALYNPEAQLRSMRKQVVALVIYPLSFLRRAVGRLVDPQHRDTHYLRSPLLFFVADSAVLLGRLWGLWETRFFSIDVRTRVWEEPI